MDLAPKEAHRLREDGNEVEVPPSEVATGEKLRVRPGEALPVAGVVVGGRSSVDEVCRPANRRRC
jgi:P-type Cu+ transporter